MPMLMSFYVKVITSVLVKLYLLIAVYISEIQNIYLCIGNSEN